MATAYGQLSSFFQVLNASVFENMPCPCMCISADLQIIYLNAPIVELLKFQADKTPQLSDFILEILPSQPDENIQLADIIHMTTQNGSHEHLCGLKTYENMHFSAQISFNAIRQDAEIFFICYVKPVEEMVEMTGTSCSNTELSKALLDTMPLVLHIWSKDYELIDCSTAALLLFKVNSKEEYIANFSKFSPLYQPDGLSSELMKQYLQQAFDKGKCTFQWINLDNSGRSFPSDETLCCITLDGEERVIGYTHDISAVTENILNITIMEERTRAILDVTPMAINIWDKNLKMRDCNLESLKIFGYNDKEEFLSDYENTIPKFQPDGKKSLDLLNKGMTAAFMHGYYHFDKVYGCSKTGEPLIFEITYIRLVLRDEEMVIAYLHDLREITKVLNTLKANEARIQAILDLSPLGINVWSGEHELLDCNESIVRLFGFDDKEQYISNRDLIIPPTQADGTETHIIGKECIKQAFAHGKSHAEFTFLNKTGDEVPVEITFKKTILQDEERVISFVRDLRELKSMLAGIRAVEQDLRTARDTAEQSAKAKSEFLANMSHEIRTPLNGVLGLLHLLAKTELLPAQKSYVDKTIFSAGNLLRIINDILDFSKIEAGKLEMECIPFTLREISNEVKLLFEPQAAAKNLQLEFIKNELTNKVMLGDPLRIKQIFFNLVSNAIKFTEHGSIVATMEGIEDKNNMRCSFSVKDSGIGMSQAQCSRLFSAFMQADTSFTRKYGGTGLGLVIARRIARLMQGDLWVESEEGKGSTFYFTAVFAFAPTGVESSRIQFSEEAYECNTKSRGASIAAGTNTEGTEEYGDAIIFNNNDQSAAPAPDTNDLSAPKQEQECQATPTVTGTQRKAHILLVEDNHINQLIAEELLKSAGHTVDIADNGQEALHMLYKNLDSDVKYNLVFMDIQMPVMDGLTTVARIREDAKLTHYPVVAMSAHAMTGDKEISLAHGMNEHITKPILPEILFNTVITYAKFDD